MYRFVFRQLARALFVSAVFISAAAISVFSQSPLQDQPTPVIRNEIEAAIKARDVGDARLTTHYYWFDGAQGDVFINWTSKNFAGDVDLFIQNGLRPISKIVVYADFGEVETGRVIYLRKPERLLLRVQGRTPNDDVASYRLKFAGSFVAATSSEKDVPEIPTVGENLTGAVRVNSVGTILPPPPKPVETKTETSAPPAESNAAISEPAKSETEKVIGEKIEVEEKKDSPKLEVVIVDPIKKADPPKISATNRPPRRNRAARTATVKKGESQEEKSASAAKAKEVDSTNSAIEKEADPAAKTETESKGSSPEKAKTSAKVDPLANVNLVIMFKDGSKIERPLPEVFRFSVDRGVLTVVAKDGRVGKYQMIDVAKVTIE